MKKIFATLMLALTIAACGGGGDATAEASTQTVDNRPQTVDTKPLLVDGYRPDGTLPSAEELCHADEQGQQNGKPAKC